ncbi:STE like transcription factor-domain-containing protein [Pisolithus croceorrhizus]|nr:STE like transcription factor-domain-containing protein [Pisolithus croceorrhizus]
MDYYRAVPEPFGLRASPSQSPLTSGFGPSITSSPLIPMSLSGQQLPALPPSDHFTASDSSLAARDTSASYQQSHWSYTSTDNSLDSSHPSADLPPTFNPIAMGLSSCNGLSRPLTTKEQENLIHLDRLRYFLKTAPSRWSSDLSSADYSDDALAATVAPYLSCPHPAMTRFCISSSEHVTCVFWSGQYYITGTDIVRSLVFRFEAFGRPVRNIKKFEEGIFSDLRNLKHGIDATLEEPKSPFLDLLYKYQCIRTQKKQKVFYWYSVPHDRLFLDALERDLSRDPTTVPVGEPALSFKWDRNQRLYEQFGSKAQQKGFDGNVASEVPTATASRPSLALSGIDERLTGDLTHIDGMGLSRLPSPMRGASIPLMPITLFDGSPTYKQRRKKPSHKISPGLSPIANRNMGECEFPFGDTTRDVGYGVGDRGMSAADMFSSQARMAAEIGALSSAEAVRPARDDSAIGNGSSRDISAALPLSADNGRHARFSHLSAKDNSRRVPHPSRSQTDPTPPQLVFDMEMPTTTTSRAFVCPSYSCGRLFKRGEHLKRHLRTHTMERPYQCDMCKKRFSRSDNLHQHIRIHTRVDGQDMGSGDVGVLNGDADEEMEDGDLERLVHVLSTPYPVDAEGLPDLTMYEVEVPGHVQEVQGDEEGLLVASDITPGFQENLVQSGRLYNVEDTRGLIDVQSDAGLGHFDSFSSFDTTAATWTGVSGSPVTGDAMALNAEPGKATHSAPSHRLDFGSHKSGTSSSAIGPIRRHRSMTPSLMKSQATTSGRSYHPYAASASSWSSQSSPSSLGTQSLDLSSFPAVTLSGDAGSYNAQPRSFSSSSLSQAMEPTSTCLDTGMGSMYPDLSLYAGADDGLDVNQPYSAHPFDGGFLISNA